MKDTRNVCRNLSPLSLLIFSEYIKDMISEGPWNPYLLESNWICEFESVSAQLLKKDEVESGVKACLMFVFS